MLRSLRRGLVAVTVFSVAVAVASAGPASAADPSSLQMGPAVGTTALLSPEVARKVKGNDPAVRERALNEYWTPERMRNARSPEMVLPDGVNPVTSLRAAGTGIDRSQEPVVIPPAAPTVAPPAEVATTEVNDVVTPNAIEPDPPGNVGFDTFRPYFPTGHKVAKTMGKVFFTMGAKERVCSAGVVSSPGKSLVWTAGHCVHGGGSNGTWAYNWLFVPNYKLNASGDPVAPYGGWPAAALFADSNWVDHKQLHSDVGVAILDRRGGQLIQEKVGAQGITFSLPYYPTVSAFGYPAEAPFDGDALWQANGPSADAGASIIYMRNLMNGGSSGGYWLTNFNGESGQVHGHNSFTMAEYPGHMFSPYYGRSTNDFYNRVKDYQPAS